MRFPGRASGPKKVVFVRKACDRFDIKVARPSIPAIGFDAFTCIATAISSTDNLLKPSAKLE